MGHSYWGFLVLIIGTSFFSKSVFGQAFGSLVHETERAGGETLELRWDNFVSSPSNMVQSDQDLLIYAHSYHDNSTGDFHHRWDLGGRYSRLEGFQFWVREAFIEQNFEIQDKAFNVSFGRKYFSNLNIDTIWNLGAIETQFRGDPFNPVHQGLTGLFVDVQALEQLKLKFFVSPLSFPNMGTNFDVKNGQVSSRSPWFVTAPTHVDLNGSVIPLTYDLDISNQYEKLVGISAVMGFEWQGEALKLSAYSGLMPSKNWTLNISPKGVVGDSGATEVLASVNPELLNRIISSISVEKDLGRGFSLAGEYFSESYLEDMTDGALQDDVQSSTIESSYVHFGLSKKGISLGAWQLKTDLYYLRRLKNEALNTFSDFEYADYNFDNAMSWQWAASYQPWQAQLQFKAFYDFTYDTILLSPRVQIQAQEDLMLYSRFDLAGSNSDQTSFISNQQSNDRFIFGISYDM